jgi:acetylornithine aminotransferase
VKAIKRAVNKRTAMVIVEPIMGEAGVIVPPDGYLRALREICTKNGVLLVLDCVQTGMGRTGQWFGYEHEKVRPDAITLAKGLGGGLPIGALVTLGSTSDLFAPGDHGTTFGGNPVATAAGLAIIKVLKKERLLASATKYEKVIKGAVSKFEGVKEVRGSGLLLGIELNSEIASSVKDNLLSKGVIVNAPNPTTIRIAPALNVNKVQIERFIKLFGESLKEVQNG